MKRKFKTKKALAAKTEFRKWADWEEGDRIVCKLVGTKPNKKNKSKNDFIVEIEEVEFSDRAAQKKFNKQGMKLTLNAAGKLNKSLDDVEMNELVEITYLGSNEIQGGDFEGEQAHDFDVNLVEEDDGSEESEESDSEEESEDDEESEEDDSDLL